ncbi:ABC transporter substrate-binding protein [Streptomyces sp. NPDC048191]|uniref:ABC transporter substrate-binding protein n=1 Tax=unclassified Streptomyces TaxID=2593676 RepID=UPI0033C32C1C
MRNTGKRWKAAAVGLAAALALTACGSGSGNGNGRDGSHELTIGLVSSFSGSAASYGEAERASLQTAVAYANKNQIAKIDGKPVTFRIKEYDSAYDPTKAVTVTRQALDLDGVRYLEVLGGGIVPAVQPLVNKENALLFATAAGDDFIGKDQSKTFRPLYDTREALKAILEHRRSEGGLAGRLVLLYPDDDLGQSLSPDAAKIGEDLGFTAHTELVGRDVTDFAPVMSKIAKTTDIIDFGPLPPSQQAVAIKQARQLGYKGIFVFSDTLILDTLLKTVSARDIEGSLSAPALEAQVALTPEGKAWAASVRKKTGQIDGWTAVVYDNLLLLAAAVNDAQTLDPAKVADALPKQKVHGILGEVSYGGADKYGIDRVMKLPYAVSEVRSGKAELVTSGS